MTQTLPRPDNAVEPDSRRWAWMVALWDALALLVVLAGMIVVFSILRPRFLSAGTFLGIANQNPEIIVIATGMTLVLMLGEIDLSVGAVLAVSNMVLGAAIGWYHLPVAVGILCCLATGLACGLVNGLIIVKWRIPSFIVTLGMLEAMRGAAAKITAGNDIDMAGQFLLDQAGGLSAMFLLSMVIVGAAELILLRTVFGRYIKAIGNNETAVRLSGITVWPVRVAVFAISGVLAALGAVMQVSRYGTANPNYGGGLELSAIAAAVIGGTSLLGGRGSAVRTLLGVLIIAVLGAGLASMDQKDWTKRIITGSLIVGAVVLDYYRQRLRKRR